MIQIIKNITKGNNFLSLLGNVVFALFGLLSFMILSRSMDRSIFGVLIIYFTASSFIDILRTGLTRSGMIRYSSGSSQTKRKEYLSASLIIDFVLVGIISIIFWTLLIIFPELFKNESIVLIFKWYPFLAISNIFWNNASSIFQAEQKFDKLLYLKVLNSGSFLVIILLNLLIFNRGLEFIIIAQIACNGIVSLLSILMKWDGLRGVFRVRISIIKEILNFGKYSLPTSVGSSLLKSADTFIIGMSPIIGAEGVAIYAIPLKIVEFFEIPIRSFVATAFPSLSKASLSENKSLVMNIFYKYSISLTMLMIPIVLGILIFSNQLIILLGGEQYADVKDQIYLILLVFCFHGLILPIDRLLGVALDSINKPDLNFKKVLYMSITNIIGNLIAVFIFKSLLFVAITTVLFTLIGIIIGWSFIKKHYHFRVNEMIKVSRLEYLNFYNIIKPVLTK